MGGGCGHCWILREYRPLHTQVRPQRSKWRQFNCWVTSRTAHALAARSAPWTASGVLALRSSCKALFGLHRRFRCLTLIDSCTRECLAIAVAYSLPNTAVIAALEAVIAGRGHPTRLSLDNGSDFAVSHLMRRPRIAGLRCSSFNQGSRCRTRMSRASTGGSAMHASTSTGSSHCSTRSFTSSGTDGPSTPPGRTKPVTP